MRLSPRGSIQGICCRAEFLYLGMPRPPGIFATALSYPFSCMVVAPRFVHFMQRFSLFPPPSGRSSIVCSLQYAATMFVTFYMHSNDYGDKAISRAEGFFPCGYALSERRIRESAVNMNERLMLVRALLQPGTKACQSDVNPPRHY